MRSIFIVGLFSFLVSYAGDQSKADSLKLVLNTISSNEESLPVLKEILFHEFEPKEILAYAELMLEKAGDNLAYKYVGLHYYGVSKRLMGDLDESMKWYLQAIQTAKDAGLDREMADSYAELSNLYYLNRDFTNAGRFSREAIAIYEALNDSAAVCYSNVNVGYHFYELGALDSAEYYYRYAEQFSMGRAYLLLYIKGNLALVNAKNGQVEDAIKDIKEVIEGLSASGDEYAICDYQGQIAGILMSQNDYNKALIFAESSLRLALKNGLKDQLKNAYNLLAQIYVSLNDFEKAYEYEHLFFVERDSLMNADLIRRLADQQREYEVGIKQAEIDLVNAQIKTERIILFGVMFFAFVLIVMAVVIFKFYRSKARVNKVLEVQKKELQSLNEAKDKFFSIISHDLRGPVASFFGISRMIKFLVKSKATDSLIEIADDIDDSVSQLSGLLDNLLNWATQQRGQIPYVPEKLELKQMADDLARTLATMAQGKNIDIVVSVDESICLWSDRNTTMTILRNLVNNSLKFTAEGGQVNIAAEDKDEDVEIRISDTGVGMSQEKLERIFQLTGERSTYGTSGEKGLGLGLQLVKEFVDLNHGVISVISEEGRGTTFSVSLPKFTNEAVELTSK